MRALVSLLQALPDAKVLNGHLDRPVGAIHYDSRQVTPGSLFVCVPGLQTDGHLFINEALARGATTLVVQYPVEPVPADISMLQVPDSRLALARLAAQFFAYPARRFNLVGITGTNGKTSTSIILETILQFWGKKIGRLGTLGSRIDGKALPTSHTTPESLEIQSLFHKMAEKQLDYVIMEVSSHALSLARVAEVEFDVGVFTNLSQDHLDFHGCMEAYRDAKLQLFRSLGPGAKTRKKYGVINGDDPAGNYFQQAAAVPVFTYGLTGKRDFLGADVRVKQGGVSFSLPGWSQATLALPLAGRFNVYNALAAIAVASQEGVPFSVIKTSLERFAGVPGRFEAVAEGQDFAVIVDYAHTPDGLENVLRTAREICPGRIITVFGCGGDRDRSKRPLMGEVACRWSDYTIITSDNPRTEDLEAIIADIEPAFVTAAGKYHTVLDRRQAIYQALSLAGRGDLILIAGKGHEDYQIIGKTKYPFSDQLVVKEFLRGE